MARRGVAIESLRPWTAIEEELLREHYRRGQVRQLAALLDRTPESIRAHWGHMKNRCRDAENQRNAESRPIDNGRRWTLEEHTFVAETLDLPVAEVAACVNRSIFATEQRRHRILNGETFHFMDDSPRGYAPRPERRQVVAAVHPPQPTCPRCTLQHVGEC